MKDIVLEWDSFAENKLYEIDTDSTEALATVLQLIQTFPSITSQSGIYDLSSFEHGAMGICAVLGFITRNSDRYDTDLAKYTYSPDDVEFISLEHKVSIRVQGQAAIITSYNEQ